MAISDLDVGLSDFQRVVDALAIPAIILDDERRIVCANAESTSLFGVLSPGTQIVRVLRQPEIGQMLDRVRESTLRQTCDIVVHRSTARNYVVAVGPLDAVRQRYLLTLTDISFAMNAERSRSTFVANVSHELRSPLTTLLGVVETLQGPARNDMTMRDRFLELMKAETQRMSRLVGDLLSLAKVESREHLAPEDTVDLNGVLAQVVEIANVSHETRRIDLDLDPDCPRVQGSADDLLEVFQNIVENALRYSPPDTSVDIVTNCLPAHGEGTSKRVAIEVIDRGDGIASEHIPFLTDRFYRVDKGRSREMGGTGLGLAIVKHILNRYGGRLNFDSEAGEGTTVTVTLRAE